MKIFVVIIGIIVPLILGILSHRLIYPPSNTKKQKKGPSNPKRTRQEATREAEDRKSAQDVLGLSDVVGADVIMSDGTVINIIEIECLNSSLMTMAERHWLARSTSKVLAAINKEFTIIKHHRQADNTQHIGDLKESISRLEDEIAQTSYVAKNDEAGKRRRFLLARHDILSGKLDSELERNAQTEQKLQTMTYVCLKTGSGENSTKRAREQSSMLLRHLEENGLYGRLLVDIELIDILKAYFDEPMMAPTVNINPYAQMPLVYPEIQSLMFDRQIEELDIYDRFGMEVKSA